MTRDPRTPGEWQEAVDLAHVMLLIESARLYGLISGGPKVNGDRCQQLLNAGECLGYRPAPDSLARWLGE